MLQIDPAGRVRLLYEDPMGGFLNINGAPTHGWVPSGSVGPFIGPRSYSRSLDLYKFTY